MPARRVSNAEVRHFWERNPVAAAAIPAEPGSRAFFEAFDALREAEHVEPYPFSNRMHGYESSAGKRVLDVGCGNGYVLAHYARNGGKVHGIDLTETALRLSRRRFELAGLEGAFRLTDGEAVPYPDGHFDIVCAMGVLHHIEEPRPMVAEIYRVLKPGGRIILMLYYRYSWKYIVVLRLKCVFDPRYRGRSLAEALNMNDGADCPFVKVYSKSEARELLNRFQDVRLVLNQLSWKQLLLNPPLARLLEPVLPTCSESVFARYLGWNLYVQAIKPLNS